MLFILFLFVYIPLFSQELNNESEYYDFGSDDGITIYANHPRDEYSPDTVEHYVLEKLKERYLNIELGKIKSAFERYKNPSENYLRALENLGDSLKTIWEE
jgi:hypothetical protein